MEKEDLEEILCSFLEKYKDLNEEVHSAHHAFIEAMIKKEERKQQRIETIKTQVGGWGIILALGFLGKAVWDFVENQLK